MKDKIQKYKEDGERLQKELKQFVQDKNNSLSERWDLFCFAKMGNNEGWIQHFESINEIFGEEVSWFDDFYKSRNQTVYLENILEELVDCEKEPTEEQLNKVKEEVLERFIWSFELDW